MNTIKKYMLMLFLFIGLLAMSGCKKFLDINRNPSNPQIPKAEFMISRAIFQMANGTSEDYMQLFKLVQYWSSTTLDDRYDRHGMSATGSDVTGVIWRLNYVDLGLNIEEMIKDGIENKKYEYAGIGYAIKAWSFQMTTDMYGEIILDEAFTDPNKLTFRYQYQRDVYERVREWSQLSIKYLNMKSPSDYSGALAGPSGDYMYRGDVNKWKKFVYANLALQYGHLVNKSSFATTYADSVVKYVDLSFTSVAEDATVKFTASNEDDSNVFGPLFGRFFTVLNTANGRISSTILNLLAGGVRGVPVVDPLVSVDPRLSRMLSPTIIAGSPPTWGPYKAITPTKGGTGVPHVLGPPTGIVTAPYIGKYLFSNASEYVIMSYAQLQFAKAEALFLKGDKAGAFTAYKNAIRAHMAFVNRYGMAGNVTILPAEIELYMASTEVAQTEAELTISDIMNQKYIAQWGWAGLEQWCDLRKYHYDPTVFTQYYQLSGSELNANNKGKYAYRYRPRYNSEYAWNRTELDKWGGLASDYNTKETWFSTTEN
ncbi:SusD/RagB family nutrient-binding outer membrane lipoprotein [Pedobacter hiemivivus]|uniref:SusD/RagB family nutrient-binding outer membrane lipoprotein n=1 Tax=Pedobacter hiemivivus TaxID=2530454 RepID=A0A4R0MJD9_9SPHI|nr:SusD/RagB family nutrient-binding outer membrane lipoprotein [Pedobacter hiemivivus]TCC86513.1 SusD/RagB family nutrient-binding outer membrane lipoprotein [Pedobacter hiemivivus]